MPAGIDGLDTDLKNRPLDSPRDAHTPHQSGTQYQQLHLRLCLTSGTQHSISVPPAIELLEV
jgi:hypothetical protein